MTRRPLKAAIRIGGKIYTATRHLDAIDKARKEGKSLPAKGSPDEDDFREKNGLFLLSDGKIINRKQAMEEFGKDHSEEFFPDKTDAAKKKG